MSGFVKAGFSFLKNLGKGQKTTGTEVIKSFPIAKNLNKKKTIKDELISARDKQLAGVRDEAKVEIKSKNPLSKYTKKIEKIVDRKAKGGRVGLKRGTSLMQKKSNVQKIKETFGPRQSQVKNLKSVDKKKNPGLAKLPIEVRNKMGYAAKGGRAMLKTGSKFPDLNKDGKITKADILMGRGVIKKNKKKVI